MANEEQLAILRQGVEVWNNWRYKNANVTINLTRAILTGVDLTGINFVEAKLFEADLSGAVLDEARLRHANLRGADLANTRLRRADLRNADLSGAYLTASKLSQAQFYATTLGNLDFSETDELKDAVHHGPSTISTNTFTQSKGKIPEIFLRGCGLSDWEIEFVKLYNPELTNDERNNILYKTYGLQASRVIQISPLFISYSHADETFVDNLENQLNAKGIRFWRDKHEMKAGRIETQIDRAINQNRTVLLVLSEHSLNSDWVEHEVRTARELEKDMKRDVLCPVALDDSWKDSRWPKRVMEQIMEYNILDFSAWKDDVKFEGMFRKLIDGLELFYKG
jgi:hypothetical protein